MNSTYFRKGFGLKGAIEEQRGADYHSGLVDLLRARDYSLAVGPLTFRLAREFGFCYGVDRAVDYAYETRHKFPDRRLLLVGEIIHNPHVNRKLEEMGIEFLHHGPDGEFDFSAVTPDDVVIMPAFGVTIHDFERLRAHRLRDGGHHLRLGAQRVEAGGGLRPRRLHRGHPRQALPRGDQGHGEPGDEVSRRPLPRGASTWTRRGSVCDFIEQGGDAAAHRASGSRDAALPASTSTRDLERVGIANQTTMLSGESLAIAEEFRRSMARRYGARGPGRPLPHVRHHLLRHPGAAGRGGDAAARSRST